MHTDAEQHALRASRLSHAAIAAVVAAAVPTVAGPTVPLAWIAVAAGLVAAAAAVATILVGRPRHARTPIALAALAFVAAQLLHSPLVLTDMPLLLSRAVLFIALPIPMLTAGFVFATLAADAQRLAWGRRYQQRAGYQPSRLVPDVDWA
jgi:hypothetical protein